MKKIILTTLVLIFALASMTQAATLHWGQLADTETCKIAGYKIYWTDDQSQPMEDWWSTTVDATIFEKDIAECNLNKGVECHFSVSAFSIEHREGPVSDPIQYTPPLPEIPTNPKPVIAQPVIVKVGNVKITVEEIDQ